MGPIGPTTVCLGLAFDRNPHRAGRPLDDPGRVLQVARPEVVLLLLGDLQHLLLGDLEALVLARLLRQFLGGKLLASGSYDKTIRSWMVPR